jgi:hypothetical protein
MATIEDRVSRLELAQSATSDALARLDRKVDALDHKVDAMHRVIAESEQRLRTQISTSIDVSEKRMREAISAIEKRMREAINATERRFVDLLNDRFDQVMAALDRPRSP